MGFCLNQKRKRDLSYGFSKSVDISEHLSKLYAVTSQPITPFFTACVFGLEEVIGALRIDDINFETTIVILA